MKTKLLTLVGTRPELIRLSKTIELLDKEFDHILVHTGQNYSPELSDIFFTDLNIRRPDHYLEIDVTSLGRAIGDIISKLEVVLDVEKPKALLVLGDTNSSLGAIIAKRKHVTVYHWEAGNRSFDPNVPEEINRKIIDHLADFNLAYSEAARRNLIAEGLSPRRTFVTGSPMKEILDAQQIPISKSQIHRKLNLERQKYVLASFHRQENVDNPGRLRTILDTLGSVAVEFKLPVIVSTHPRTLQQIESLKNSATAANLFLVPPCNFTDYVALQKDAFCVISDSGTISEESSILNFPAITIRDSMERPEALEAGAILMTGIEATQVIQGIKFVRSSKAESAPAEYAVGDASRRVVSIIRSTLEPSRSWDGLVNRELL